MTAISDVDAIRSVITLAGRCAARGWTPATAGNFSARASEGRVAITRSGADKGSLAPADILLLPLGEPPPREASAEAPIHWSIYSHFAAAGAIAHAHPPATVVSSMLPDAQPALRLHGHELLKVLPGIATHEATVEIPVLPNTQDMIGLAARLEWKWAAPALILAGHGIYVWGRDGAHAFRYLEALDFMFDLELRRRQIR